MRCVGRFLIVATFPRVCYFGKPGRGRTAALWPRSRLPPILQQRVAGDPPQPAVEGCVVTMSVKIVDRPMNDKKHLLGNIHQSLSTGWLRTIRHYRIPIDGRLLAKVALKGLMRDPRDILAYVFQTRRRGSCKNPQTSIQHRSRTC